MKYTDPKLGITVSAPDGLSHAEINAGLRGLIDDLDDLAERRSAEWISCQSPIKGLSDQADEIGFNAFKSRSPIASRSPEVSWKINQMIMLYAILLELRKMNGLR